MYLNGPPCATEEFTLAYAVAGLTGGIDRRRDAVGGSGWRNRPGAAGASERGIAPRPSPQVLSNAGPARHPAGRLLER